MKIDLARYISVLSYIRARGTVTLGELAEHYKVPIKDMYQYLWTLYVLEIVDSSANYISPISLSLDDSDPDDPNPDPQLNISLDELYSQPGVEFGGTNSTSPTSDACSKADRRNALRGGSEYDNYTVSYPQASVPCESTSPKLSFAEVIGIIATIDSLMYAADTETVHRLSHLRTLLTNATRRAGYRDELWTPPVVEGGRDVNATVHEAIKKRLYITMDYWKAQGSQAVKETITVAPLYIEAHERPLLKAVNQNDAIRTFRMDRVSHVIIEPKKLGVKAFNALCVQARRAQLVFHGQEVKLYCDSQAYWLIETLPGAQLFRQADGELVVTLEMRSAEWLRTLVARLGAHLHKIEPEDIASTIAEHSQSILNSYNHINNLTET